MNLFYIHVMNHLIGECSELEIHQCMGDGVVPYMGDIHVGMCGKWKPLLVSNSHILDV